ncbi:hypothetical protein MBLNU13_g05597t1 [Cladosporium sp. NU13]
MSSTLSYLHAKGLLSEVEKDRIVCTYFNSTEPNAVDWDKATREYGAASVDSYKKGMQNTTKKIKKAMESGVEPEAADATPAKKGGGGKKRKKTAEAEADGEAEESPMKKKGGRKTKAQKEAEVAAAAAAEEAEDSVKAEDSE